LIHENNATQAQEAERLEAWDLYYAKGYSKLLDKARASSKSAADQVKQLRDMAKKAGFDLRAIVALCDLAGHDDCRVAFSLQADGLDFSKSAGQASALPASP
jgi:hypothetical protein